MKRLLLSLLALCALTVVASAADKDTVKVRPGETVYVQFEKSGKRMKLVNWSTEPNESAQVIATFEQEARGPLRRLKMENKFPQDLVYKCELRSVTMKLTQRGRPTPVVGGKVAFDEYPSTVEELALFDFKLQR